jgi:hypothetical protein
MYGGSEWEEGEAKRQDVRGGKEMDISQRRNEYTK